MARVDILKRLYSKDRSSFDFKFDMLMPRGGILTYISLQDINEFCKFSSTSELSIICLIFLFPF